MADHQVREDSGSRPSAIVQQTLDVLVVERASGHATTVEQLLAEARGAMLARRGTFTVTQADCMAEALSQLRRRRFSVVLLDLQFPGDCGLDSLEQIRLTASETPVIVLAGTDDDGMALRAISAGAQDFLPKEQLEARLLVRTIFNAVERKRVETQLRRRTRDLEKAHARIKQQAAELERRNDELDRINGELEEFTYIASHDLKEPLRGIRAYCEIIREDYGPALDEEGERRLEKMGELCRRLETLIADLLTYCRVGGATPTTSTVDLDLVVADVLDMLRPAIEARNAVVRVDGPLPCVTGDAMLLGLAMANLVSNGLKFNRSERPTVEIGTASGQQPIVYVRDNG
ncbi:MAG: response regulator, partial [Patescibacteria group bacterium]|nr:response regulator [Patescibacteria group bacterium]